MLIQHELTFCNGAFSDMSRMDILIQPASVILTLCFECVSAARQNANANQMALVASNGLVLLVSTVLILCGGICSNAKSTMEITRSCHFSLQRFALIAHFSTTNSRLNCSASMALLLF